MLRFLTRSLFPATTLALALICLVTNDLRAEKELIIVSPHWEGIQYEFGRAFEAYYKSKTGETVRVRWRDLGGTSQIEKALDASYKATPESSQVDIFFGGGADPFESQKRKGQLEPYKLPDEILSQIPAHIGGFEIVDSDYAYYGAALSSFGILENRRVIETVHLPAVETWEDLCAPELLGWVSSSDPRKSGSVHMIYEIILQAYGWDRGWEVIYQSSGNVKSFLQSSSQPTKEVSVGDAAYAISIDINGMTQQSFLGKENVRFKIPAGVSVINPDGIAIMKGAPHPEVAREFLNFVLSRDGQLLWMTPTGSPGGPVKFGISRMGILPSLYEGDMTKLLVPLNPFMLAKTFVYQSGQGSKRWNVVNDLIGQTVIDVHSHLVAAWKAICALPAEERAPYLKRFNQPPVTEAQAMELASFWRTDKIRAGRLTNQWMSDAVARYRGIEQDALKAKRTSNKSL